MLKLKKRQYDLIKWNNMVKILIDGIHLGPEMMGVGRYVFRILEYFIQTEKSMQFYVIVMANTPKSFLPQGPNVEYLYVSWLNQLWHGLVVIPKLVRTVQPNAVLIPYDTPVGPLQRPYAMVFTEIPHNIRPKEVKGPGFIKWKLQKLLFRLLTPVSLRQAAAVFPISSYNTGWLVNEVHVDPGKIILALCAPAADFHRLSREVKKDEVWRRLGTPQGYILIFYTGAQRENIDIVLQVYNRLVEQGHLQDLVISGVRDHMRPYLVTLFADFAWRDRVKILPFITGDNVFSQLAEIYGSAQVYLDPSLHEGFGMQVIEAMACGAPVVCSNRASLPEVAGDAAILVDPMNVGEIVAALDRVLRDETLRQELMRRGYKRSGMYSWPRTAKIILTKLRDIVSGNQNGQPLSH
jgi:glycosyltransferase involved in cell wall biosynthesis